MAFLQTFGWESNNNKGQIRPENFSLKTKWDSGVIIMVNLVVRIFVILMSVGCRKLKTSFLCQWWTIKAGYLSIWILFSVTIKYWARYSALTYKAIKQSDSFLLKDHRDPLVKGRTETWDKFSKKKWQKIKIFRSDSLWAWCSEHRIKHITCRYIVCHFFERSNGWIYKSKVTYRSYNIRPNIGPALNKPT